ncbi:MAG: hypothetical protein SGILL_010126, partial [Bacillariaceae sp.]
FEGEDAVKHLKRDIPDFARLLREKFDTATAMQEFRQAFQKESKRMLQILEDPKHLHLIRDFQFMLSKEARVYHIDFERGALKYMGKVGAYKTRLDNLKWNLERLLYWLTENEDYTFQELKDEVFCMECERESEDDDEDAEDDDNA